MQEILVDCKYVLLLLLFLLVFVLFFVAVVVLNINFYWYNLVIYVLGMVIVRSV